MTDPQVNSFRGETSGLPSKDDDDRARKVQRLCLLVVVLMSLWAFKPAMQNDFVDWDDQQILVDNTAYQDLSAESLHWMFTTGFAGHYQPLTWLSYALESQLWGVSPAGFHATNLILHVGVALALFGVAARVIRRATGEACPVATVIGATTAALLFSVHPLRVESVAWATERRDVLSGLWLMLALLAYLRAVTPQVRRSKAWLAVSLACYVVSLLSKAWGITFPVVLVVLDIYPLRRFGSGDRGVRWRRILGEKVLFLIPALGIAIAAIWAQQSSGAFRALADHDVGLRVGQALYGLSFYLHKTLWPAGLVPLYEQEMGARPWDWPNLVGGFVSLLLTVLAIRLRRRWPGLLTAWCVYVVVVSPVLGLAQSGPQVVADRYSYLSCMCWAVLIGACVATWWARAGSSGRSGRPALLTLVGLVSIALVVASRAQTGIWRDSRTLWTVTLERAPNTPLAHAHLAVIHSREGTYDVAADHARSALARLPGNLSAHAALGESLLMMEDERAAIPHLHAAMEGYRTVGRPKPGLAVLLAVAFTKLGQMDQAEQLYREALAEGAGDPQFPFLLGSFLASQGRHEESVGYLGQAVASGLADDEAYYRLATVQLLLSRPAEAITTLEAGLSRPDPSPHLAARLAWVLSTCTQDELRDGPRALKLANSARQTLGGDDAVATEALGAALAETGDFTAAFSLLSRFLAEHADALSASSRSRLEAAIASYSSYKPMRE